MPSCATCREDMAPHRAHMHLYLHRLSAIVQGGFLHQDTERRHIIILISIWTISQMLLMMGDGWTGPRSQYTPRIYSNIIMLDISYLGSCLGLSSRLHVYIIYYIYMIYIYINDIYYIYICLYYRYVYNIHIYIYIYMYICVC